MPVGIHLFYAYSIADSNRIGNKGDYFIGRFVGDHFADERFAERLKKIESLLCSRYGHNYCRYWSPPEEKPYKPRTREQRLATSIKKAGNKNAKNVEKIRNANYLFENQFIAEEEEKLSKRIAVLKDRYKT